MITKRAERIAAFLLIAALAGMAAYIVIVGVPYTTNAAAPISKTSAIPLRI